MFKKPFFPERDDLFYPFQSFLDKVYDELTTSNGVSTIKAKSGYPRWDVYETNEVYRVEIALPGLNADDVQIEILPDMSDPMGINVKVLKISGKMNSNFQLNDSQVKYYIRELRRSAFERYLQLPDYVKGDPTAVMAAGVLTLHWDIERQPKKILPKKIPITVMDKKPLENGSKPP
jgi:HSP20 family molecular chaperone IbpA